MRTAGGHPGSARREDSLKRFLPWFEEVGEGLRVLHEDREHEIASNYWRLCLLAALSVAPAVALWLEGPRPENKFGLAVTGAAFLYAASLLVVLPRFYRPWLRYLTVGTDVTLVTVLLLGFAVAGRGLVAANSQTVFLLYFLVLAMVARRHDVRLAAFGAGAVLVQYAALVAAGWLSFGLPDLPPDPDYGSFSWPNQVGRALALVLASALMLGNVVSARRLKEIGVRDSLTGVFNRRYFQEVLALEFDHSREVGKPLTVAMVDVDGFKRYNDDFGHVRGDRVLIAISDFLLRNLRRSDLLARYGGDEFVILLLETPPEGAGVLLSRIQERTATWLREVLGPQASYVNLSFGLSTLAPEDREPVQLVNRADQHLYRAKKAGGGVVCDEAGQILVRRERGTTQRIELTRK